MTKDELLERLAVIRERNNKYIGHIEADTALLMYIDDNDVWAAFDAIEKRYD